MNTPDIVFDRVTFAYGDDDPVLRDISLRVEPGQFVALVGANGAGKTTLARHLIGLLRPTQGAVRIGGQDIAGQSVGRIARQVGFAFQSPETQIFSPTVRDEIAFGPRNLGLSGGALAAQVQAALAEFGLLEQAELPPAALGFSARRRVALASVLAMQTPVLVVDEPTVGLDTHGHAQVLDWLTGRHEAGGTVILITHDMDVVEALAERVLVLHAGRLLADDAPLAVFRDEALLRTAGLRVPFYSALALALGRPDLAQTPPQVDRLVRAWLERVR